jgi:large subunit ribosomal protein L16
MLVPNKTKHRKVHRGRARFQGNAQRGTTVAFGEYGLKATSHGWITSRQIEAARRAMTRYVKRGGQIWIRIFPDKPVTQKGEQMPMGKGKGAVDHYVAVVKPGTVIFEMADIPADKAKEALRLAQHKLPVTTKFVTKVM